MPAAAARHTEAHRVKRAIPPGDHESRHPLLKATRHYMR
jgi:hypothetical protein